MYDTSSSTPLPAAVRPAGLYQMADWSSAPATNAPARPIGRTPRSVTKKPEAPTSGAHSAMPSAAKSATADRADDDNSEPPVLHDVIELLHAARGVGEELGALCEYLAEIG